MSENRDSIDGFISEITASLNQPDQQAFLRRVNTERMLVLLVNDLMEENQADNIHILPDNRLAGKAGADFLLQVDDYDFRLELIDAPNENLSLNLEHLQNTVGLLEENPSTLALIFVWTTDTLDAIPLSLARIKYLLQNPDRISGLLRQARPVREVITELIQRQIKIWDVRLDQSPRSSGQGVDLLQVFSEEIGKAIDIEMHRNYRNEERSQAARMFPYQQEKQFLISVLQDALKGTEAKQLIDRLVRVQKRGVR